MNTSVPNIILLRASSLTVNDLPAPDLAKTTELAFSSSKRSKRIRPLLWRLIPYRMPRPEVSSEELKGKVAVNAVLPSIIDTATNRASMPKADFSKWVTPQELADVILFLVSDAASAVTGALIPVAGRV